jgi:uncharacterized protein YxjI
MPSYEVTHALLTVSAVYSVRHPRESRVLFTVRGESSSATPKYRLVEGETGEERAVVAANFIKTRYEMTERGAVIGSLVFPAVAFDKTFTLTVGPNSYAAEGGVFRGVFLCKDDQGRVVLEITKALSIRDTFLVEVEDEKIKALVAILAAISIHSRFYEMV